MHDPKLQEKALEYVRGLAVMGTPATDRFSRAELARHLVGFAESVLRPCVWLVCWSYNGDAEEVIDSVWADEEHAREHAATVDAPREVYVTRYEVRSAAQPQGGKDGT